MTGLAVARRDPGSPPAVRTLALELGLFAALAAFAAAQWARLVVAPPIGRMVLVLAIVTAAAAALGTLGLARLRPRFSRPLAAAIALLSTAAALVAIGLPAHLLAPANWGELFEGIGLGLAGIEDTELPHGGGDGWLRLTLLLGAPPLLGVAAALAFWPARRRAPRRFLALVALLTLYGVAVTLDSPGAEVLWGVPLLLLVAAWLWMPRLGSGWTPIAVVAAAGILAVPVATALERERPWWNYEGWNWFAGSRGVSFDWEHTYGPLEWPRDGTTMLEVRSDRPLYWKAQVLDRFDGFTWTRAEARDDLAAAELAARRRPLGAALPERHPEWRAEASFEIRGLRSRLVVGAGTTQSVEGVDGAAPTSDGTTPGGTGALERGDEYTVRAYAPQPSAARMRRAPQSYPARAAASTAIGLSLSDSVVPGVAPPLWGERRPGLGATLRETSYGDMYGLAPRLTAGAPTVYDAARSVETHLRRRYEYEPLVPQYGHDLPAFLFQERRGYCQQFSGSMALMLRMVGIPSRVVAGFAPGRHDPERGLYEVRDFDAHSWVEVYFRGIGWVTFDPTPAAAPAFSESLNPSIAALLRRGGPRPGQGLGFDGELGRVREAGGRPGGGRAGESPWGTVLGVGGGAALAAALGLGVVFVRRRRRLASGWAAEDQLRELREALERLGWPVAARTTLLALERRAAGVGRRGVARYASALRASRFEPAATKPPGPRQRRALRSALAAGGGPRRRWRALLAIPPGGPAPR